MTATNPVHRTILAVDIEGSTAQTNSAKALLRADMYQLVEESLLASGISEDYRDPLIDRGDGILILISPVDEVPKTTLLTTTIPQLTELLTVRGGGRQEQRLRMRAVIHAGEVHFDARGVFGEALDIAFRMLDTPELRAELKQTTAPMALAVSDLIYHSVVMQDYDGIDRSAFRPLAPIRIGQRVEASWVTIPSRPVDQPWAFHPATGDVRVDRLLHLAGQELDTRSTVQHLDPDLVTQQIFRTAPNALPGAG